MHGGSPSGTRLLPLDQLVRAGVEGDILVFMPGAYEILRTIDALGDARRPLRTLRCCMASCLRQNRIGPCVRSLAARSSSPPTWPRPPIAIEGVRAVIDSGLARIARFDPHRASALYVEPISQAAADQRAGRAGRTALGAVYACGQLRSTGACRT